ncbi:MAG TPA: glycogen debranching protein GlgX [Candidatus Binataceae bacterium]|nr:glycogen debranching protein GlgX [Candidatus Binataceae bacterium]
MSSGIAIGSSAPLGARVLPGGVNFSVYSKNATSMELLLFDGEDDVKPSQVVTLDPRKHRTYHYWHVMVPGIREGQLYGFRAGGEFSPERGLRFDGSKVLLDPYGLAVAIPKAYSRTDASAPAMKSIVVDPGNYSWDGDQPLRRRFVETIIYEVHVRGFTRHPSSGVTPERAGTYAGLVEKIPYLVELGITAVELMPVFQFDAADAPDGLINYWGYAPVSFFAPHRAYSSRQDLLGPMDEFRDMVKALHRAGIEVILDVVFNHTAEGDEHGPTLCLRGLGNETYYLLDRKTGRYANYSGTGNTLNANQPIVRRMIIDSLRYWVTQMHVDGFRFDLASVLARDETGEPVLNPPVILDIESHPMLAGTKFIAEAWDAGGLYQVGSFVGDAWQEWNGKFRDDVRGFVKGDRATVRHVTSRLLGSPDIYGHKDRGPEQSVNFITCHDGFTLNDLVSYNQKHNEANGEQNRDGTDDNLSWNCGVEGPTGDPAVEALRIRQIKNFIALTLIAVGTPMLLMGDEVRRTQRGNNNAYCQDNELSWFDWRLHDRNAGLFRFVKMLTRFRERRDVVMENVGLAGLTLNQLLAEAQIRWHGIKLYAPDWGDDSHSIAFTVRSLRGHFTMHAMLNAYWQPLTFELPPTPGKWRRWIDTSLASPDDISAWEEAPVVSAPQYTAESRSVVFLVDIGG